jgi:hypothetical protein
VAVDGTFESVCLLIRADPPDPAANPAVMVLEPTGLVLPIDGASGIDHHTTFQVSPNPGDRVGAARRGDDVHGHGLADPRRRPPTEPARLIGKQRTLGGTESRPQEVDVAIDVEVLGCGIDGGPQDGPERPGRIRERAGAVVDPVQRA